MPLVVAEAMSCSIPIVSFLCKYAPEETLTNNLDGFGSFHLTIESDTADNKEDYKLDEHVKRVVCKFTPTGHRRNGKLNYYFCEGVKLIKVK